MRVASSAGGDGGAAGGVIGGGDGPADVGDGDGERAMAMLALPIGGPLHRTQRVVAVSYAPGGAGAGGVFGGGAVGR